jgi:hypothetical protein
MNTWNVLSISELLDAMGQDDSLHVNEKDGLYSGTSYGDWGVVTFLCLSEYELRLIFETSKEAEQAFNTLSDQLSNPYEFTNRFDMMPTVVIVRFTED